MAKIYDELGNFIYEAPDNTPSAPASVKGTQGTGSTLTLEPQNIDMEYGSYSQFGKGKSTNPAVLGNLPAAEKLLSKSDANWGRVSFGNEKDVKDKKDNAQKRAKDAKAKNNSDNLKPDNPTAASQDKSKPVLEATLAADPGNIGGAVRKALQSMVTLRMMDKLVSPGGIAGMASAAIGGALQGLAGQLGVGNMLGLLRVAMPTLSATLPGSQVAMLNLAMSGMVRNQPVGVLTPQSVAAASATAATIAAASSVFASPSYTLQTAGAIGGPALGIDPTTLAYQIALATPGTIIRKSTVVNAIAISSVITVTNSIVQDALGDIPTLNGNEHIVIADTSIDPMQIGMTAALYSSLGVSSSKSLSKAVATAAAAGVGSAIGVAVGNAIAGAIQDGVAGIADQGLQKILGSSLSGMLSNVTRLLPNIAGNILATVNVHAPLTVLNSGKISSAMNQATKTLAIARMSQQIAAVFNSNLAEQVNVVHDSMIDRIVASAAEGAAAATTIASLSAMVNGVDISCSRILKAAAIGAVGGTITGAFSRG